MLLLPSRLGSLVGCFILIIDSTSFARLNESTGRAIVEFGVNVTKIQGSYFIWKFGQSVHSSFLCSSFLA